LQGKQSLWRNVKRETSCRSQTKIQVPMWKLCTVGQVYRMALFLWETEVEKEKT
jgi:hypothetical protein